MWSGLRNMNNVAQTNASKHSKPEMEVMDHNWTHDGVTWAGDQFDTMQGLDLGRADWCCKRL